MRQDVQIIVGGQSVAPPDGEIFAITETMPKLTEGVPYLGLAVVPKTSPPGRKAWQITISCCGDATEEEIGLLLQELWPASALTLGVLEIVRRAKLLASADGAGESP